MKKIYLLEGCRQNLGRRIKQQLLDSAKGIKGTMLLLLSVVLMCFPLLLAAQEAENHCSVHGTVPETQLRASAITEEDYGLLWYLDKQAAVDSAKAQNKMIFLMWGRKECAHCNYNKELLASAAVRPIVEKGYILWFFEYRKCQIGPSCSTNSPASCNDIKGYFTTLCNNSAFNVLPGMCIVNPHDATNIGYYVAFGSQTRSKFATMLNAGLEMRPTPPPPTPPVPPVTEKLWEEDRGLLWYLDKQTALDTAKVQNKKVFLMWGQKGTDDSNQIKDLMATDEMKSILDENYVLWFFNGDSCHVVQNCSKEPPASCNEISDYFATLCHDSTFNDKMLPGICIIDPTDTMNIGYHVRYGKQTAKELKTMLEAGINNLWEEDHRLVWYLDKQAAMEAAKSQNKKIFLMWGRKTCRICNNTKGLLASDELKPLVDENYILWFFNYDKCKLGQTCATESPAACDEINGYFATLCADTAFKYLPGLCIIDPEDTLSVGHQVAHGRQDVEALRAMLHAGLVSNMYVMPGPAQAKAYVSAGWLNIVDGLPNEIVRVYTVMGTLVDQFVLGAAPEQRKVSTYPRGILMVSGSSGWTYKVFVE